MALCVLRSIGPVPLAYRLISVFCRVSRACEKLSTFTAACYCGVTAGFFFAAQPTHKSASSTATMILRFLICPPVLVDAKLLYPVSSLRTLFLLLSLVH